MKIRAKVHGLEVHEDGTITIDIDPDILFFTPDRTDVPEYVKGDLNTLFSESIPDIQYLGEVKEDTPFVLPIQDEILIQQQQDDRPIHPNWGSGDC